MKVRHGYYGSDITVSVVESGGETRIYDAIKDSKLPVGKELFPAEIKQALLALERDCLHRATQGDKRGQSAARAARLYAAQAARIN